MGATSGLANRLVRLAVLQALGCASALLLPGARGNFLTWRTERAPALHQRLAELGVVCDYRHDRLRLGFGLYHDPDDIDALAALVSQLEPRPDP